MGKAKTKAKTVNGAGDYMSKAMQRRLDLYGVVAVCLFQLAQNEHVKVVKAVSKGEDSKHFAVFELTVRVRADPSKISMHKDPSSLYDTLRDALFSAVGRKP